MAVDLEAQTPVQELQDNGTTSQQPSQKPANGAPRKPRPRRPNFNEIHAKPLPVDVYPLPAFIPHNPISIVRIAISLLSHSVFPPKSHSLVHRAYFSSQTQSIHVTDPTSIRALWEQGFWGKGSLSRSEPQWLAGEKKKRGMEAGKTSAEVTQNRREERKQFKLERARAQREAIEQQLREEGKMAADGSIEDPVEDAQASESASGTLHNPNVGDDATVDLDSLTMEIQKIIAEDMEDAQPSGAIDAKAVSVEEIKDQEHLQLTPEEAFYLSYSLGVLLVVAGVVQDASSDPLPTWYLLRLYALHAMSPIPEKEMRQLHNVLHQRESSNIVLSDLSHLSVEPDNQFILRYVVLHHFRSLGWVVRPGIKFAVDYLLYLRGPAFHHAEFAIMIVPSYSHAYWTEAPAQESGIEARQKELGKKDWWWLHRINRVQTAVFKTLVLVYVEVPPPWDMEEGWKVDVGSVLKKYTIREVVVRRWSPNRNRD